ncbi:MAG: GNAT family N-acetyltransferase [Candidatus Rokubacteria bacterium]|nr:GNAT family N-acetyltransferase [Candidatus Rokubacteria bacterium]
MELKPLDDPKLLEQIAEWMALKENYQWLDFGSGKQMLSAVSLKIMAQRDIHVIRAFTDDSGEVPIGVVGLSNVDRRFKTATPWCVLGDKRYAGRGYGNRALSKILALGFRELGLRSIFAWVVADNAVSLRMVERNNFRLIGRQRQCHDIDGRHHDRLLFDLLASEHKEL